MTYTFQIAGMSCSGCVASVKAALQQLPEVREVTVDLISKQAVIKTNQPIAEDAIRTALSQAGAYTLVSDGQTPGTTTAPKKRAPWSSVFKKKCCK